MLAMRMSLEKTLKSPKDPAGPTSPNPGPILFKQEATAVILVVKSNPSKEIQSTATENIKMMKKK